MKCLRWRRGLLLPVCARGICASLSAGRAEEEEDMMLKETQYCFQSTGQRDSALREGRVYAVATLYKLHCTRSTWTPAVAGVTAWCPLGPGDRAACSHCRWLSTGCPEWLWSLPTRGSPKTVRTWVFLLEQMSDQMAAEVPTNLSKQWLEVWPGDPPQQPPWGWAASPPLAMGSMDCLGSCPTPEAAACPVYIHACLLGTYTACSWELSSPQPLPALYPSAKGRASLSLFLHLSYCLWPHFCHFLGLQSLRCHQHAVLICRLLSGSWEREEQRSCMGSCACRTTSGWFPICWRRLYRAHRALTKVRGSRNVSVFCISTATQHRQHGIRTYICTVAAWPWTPVFAQLAAGLSAAAQEETDGNSLEMSQDHKDCEKMILIKNDPCCAISLAQKGERKPEGLCNTMSWTEWTALWGMGL